LHVSTFNVQRSAFNVPLICDTFILIMNRPEQDIILACGRVCGEAERSELLRSIPKRELDWDYLLLMANAHQVTSLLYWNLHTACRDQVPPQIFRQLRERFLAAAGRHELLTAELFRILDHLGKNGIRAIPFKGPALAHTLYENPSLREFVDLDLLVRRHEVFKALRLLIDLGYSGLPDCASYGEAEVLDREYHYAVEREDGQAFVEIHWNVLARHFVLPVPIDGWWERAGTALIQSRSVPNLSAEDLLMALCCHGCKHMWKSLMWSIDLAKLLKRRPDLDWDYVFRQYGAEDLRRIVFLGLIVANIVLDARVPSEIHKKSIQDRAAVDLARQVKATLFEHHNERGGLRFMRFQSKMKSRRMDALRFCYRTLSTSTLTEGHGVLHHLCRPLHLLRRLSAPPRK
jgi:hypothetical protein